MIHLLNVDLIGIDTNHPELGLESLRISSKNIKFGNIKFFTCAHKEDFSAELTEGIEFIEIEKIAQYIDYSTFCMKLINWCKNRFTLITHYDSFILNADMWTDSFLKFDYIGAPWADIHAKSWNLKNKVGNGGFCLRSKKMLEFSSQFNSTEGNNEDGFLTNTKLQMATQCGIRYAPIGMAYKFSVHHLEDVGNIFNPQKHFGFHGMHNYPIARDYMHRLEYGDSVDLSHKWWLDKY